MTEIERNNTASIEELPLLLSRSDRSTRSNKTGSWRFMKPRYEEKTAPCRALCPAGEDVPRIEMLSREGRFREAWETIMRENPFPAVCGRVCFHPCESGCNRGLLDDPLAIHHVERFIGEYGVQEGLKAPLPGIQANGKRIAVIGGGPSGLSAAYFLNSIGYRCDVYEAGPEAGGLLRWGIPAYRLPLSILRAEIDRIEQAGVRIHVGRCLDSDFIKQAGDRYHAVFVGCGHTKPVSPGIPGQNCLTDGLDYLRRLRDGEHQRIRGAVAVIGGGNTAVDVARSLIRDGAEPVILYRRRQTDMPAFRQEIEQALAEGVAIRELLSPRVVEKTAEGLMLNMQVMQATEDTTADGRARVVPMDGKTETLAVHQAFSAIGAEADHEWIPDEGLHLSHSRFVNRNLPVVYGGDLVSPELSVTHAILSGKQAAMALDLFFKDGIETIEARLSACRIAEGPALSMGAYVDGGAVTGSREVVSFQDIKTDYFAGAQRQTPAAVPLNERMQSAATAEMCLSRSAAEREASRCFSCGSCNRCGYCGIFCPEVAVTLDGTCTIDMDYCKGCGVCVEECPVNAMSLEVENA